MHGIIRRTSNMVANLFQVKKGKVIKVMIPVSSIIKFIKRRKRVHNNYKSNKGFKGRGKP